MKKLLAVAALALFSTPAMAATQIVEGGKLVGAKGVEVGTNTYDVSFLDGTCAGVFGTCEKGSFAFQTNQTARVAATALLDQVFLNTDLGDFDSKPDLTRGCSSITTCDIYVPFFTNPNQFSAMALWNDSGIASDQVRGEVSRIRPYDSTDFDVAFARFTLAGPTVVAAVPEPATWAMMLLGFGAVGGAARYRRRKTAFTFA